MREIRTPRLTWRGLETWHGRDAVTLADERASNGEHKLRPTPARHSSTLPMSGMWKRSYGSAMEAPPDERGGQRLGPTYRHRVTSRLYRELLSHAANWHQRFVGNGVTKSCVFKHKCFRHRLPVHAFGSVDGEPKWPQRPRMPSWNFSRSWGVICSQRSAMRRRQCIP